MARVLFVTSRLPYPPREGHQLRSWNLLRAVARDHRVDLLSLQREEDAATPDPVLSHLVNSVHCVRVPRLSRPMDALGIAGRWLGRGHSMLSARYVTAEFRRRFRTLARDAQLVHLDILAVAGLMSQMDAATPLVLNEHNVESLLLHARAEIEPRQWHRVLLHARARELEHFERSACLRATRVLACSEPDAARLRELAPGCAIDVVPNGVDLLTFCPRVGQAPDNATLVFVGQMSWFPNRDGIADFMLNTLPLIRQRHDVRLQVIGVDGGMQAPADVAHVVQFTGFVDDLRPLVQEAAVYVVPLRAGSGTRLKILEAMAMGKAIVSTRIGAEGIGLRDEEDALLADTPEEFSDAVCRLLEDRSLRQRLGDAARRTVERTYGWDAIGDRLLSTCAELLSSPRPTRH